MGHKLTDGKSIDVTAPNSTVINDGDLYRIGKWNGFAITSKTASQTDRGMALDIDPAAFYKVKLPSGLTPSVGAELFWADPTSFQKGDTHLQATAATSGDAPACKVAIAKNTNGYATVRVLNTGAGGGAAFPASPQDATFTVGTEGSNHIDVTAQFKDADGDNVAVRGAVFSYLSGDSHGDGIVGTAPTTSVAVQTDGNIIVEHASKKAWTIEYGTNGKFTLRITETGTPTFYLVVVMPDGTLRVSGAITFA